MRSYRRIPPHKSPTQSQSKSFRFRFSEALNAWRNYSDNSPQHGSSSWTAGSWLSLRLIFSNWAETSLHGCNVSEMRSLGLTRADFVHTLSRMLHKYTRHSTFSFSCPGVPLTS